MDTDELRLMALSKRVDGPYCDTYIADLLEGAADEIDLLRAQVGHETAKLRVVRNLMRDG